MGYITYNINMFEILYYEKTDLTKPAEEYILSTPVKMQVKIFKTIELLEEFGNSLRLPYSKSLDDGIFELRVKIGTDISRVLYFFVVDKKIILTNGFTKKTDKTPNEEIEKAKKYREDYYFRTKKEGK